MTTQERKNNAPVAKFLQAIVEIMLPFFVAGLLLRYFL